MNILDIFWGICGGYLIYCSYKYLFINKGELTKRLNNYTYKNARNFEVRTCIILFITGLYIVSIAIYNIITGKLSTIYYIIGGIVLVIFVLVNQFLSRKKK